MMRIRTIDEEWYVHELRGVNYVSWVAAEDRAYAAIFPKTGIEKWLAVLQTMTDKRLEAVPI